MQVAGNASLSKLTGSFSGNSQVNGSPNLNSQVSGTFDNVVEIEGNNAGIKDIKNTGVISVNPVLASAMFKANMNPASNARGQGITYSQEQKIIQKIIEKSNGTIKKSDITIWK